MKITKNVKIPKKQRLRRPRILVLKKSPRSQIPFWDHHFYAGRRLFWGAPRWLFILDLYSRSLCFPWFSAVSIVGRYVNLFSRNFAQINTPSKNQGVPLSWPTKTASSRMSLHGSCLLKNLPISLILETSWMEDLPSWNDHSTARIPHISITSDAHEIWRSEHRWKLNRGWTRIFDVLCLHTQTDSSCSPFGARFFPYPNLWGQDIQIVSQE